MSETQNLPLIALRDIVMYPGIVAPIFIAREKSLRALQECKKIGDGSFILLVTQKDQALDNVSAKDLYKIGTLAKVIQTIKLQNNNAKILAEAVSRVELINIEDSDFLFADYRVILDDAIEDINSLTDKVAVVVQSFKEYSNNNKKINPDIINVLNDLKNPSYTSNVIASHLTCKLSIKQELLEEKNITKRLEKLEKYIDAELTQIVTEQNLQQKVKKQIEKTQRDYYLQEQMKAIQKELDGDEKTDFSEMEKKIKELRLSKEAKEKAEAELKKLKMMNPMSAESSVVRNFLDVLLGLPWGKVDKKKTGIKDAEAILNRDHYGLEKVKDRIIEYLAVLQRAQKIKGPILCLIGPPGVGKTSLVKSIAEALGRKYTKFALGGVRDEAEVRGHRRTYLGSMPGKIINALKNAKTSNPVMLLDEIDKMGSDFRGDPASALLEVLDPEQNTHFVDHYLEVEYDLSNILFVATANSYNLPRALIDRMEIINISGYVEEEKLQIAKNYLVPKQFKSHNLKKSELTIQDDTLLTIIRNYTKESGVRSLEREIGSLARKALKKILTDKSVKSINVTPDDLEDYIGVKKFRYGLAGEHDQIGSTHGLAYTEVGGELLHIEAVSFPGKGEVKTTGKLGDVMKESAQAAYSCFRTRASSYGLKYEDYKDRDIHLHVPEGGIPKDGPSAGTAIFTTIVSLMTGKAVRKDVAMTGEITLSGKVLPIGGLREKLLAARRAGIKTVLIPEDNVKDLKDVPDTIKNQLEILSVNNIDKLVEHALVSTPIT